MAAVRAPYLAAYNLAQFLGWGTALGQSVAALIRAPSSVYATAGPTVRLVKGSPALAFLQWLGRSNVLFLVLHSVPELWTHWAVPVMFICWALADVVRYPWYALSLAGRPPALLTWLRYSLFLVLYPVGIACGEMPLYHAGLPYLRARGLHSLALPNALNFSFDYHRACQAALYAVLPISGVYLYQYLIRQRQKRLRSGRP